MQRNYTMVSMLLFQIPALCNLLARKAQEVNLAKAQFDLYN